jgi:hypothetical protein
MPDTDSSNEPSQDTSENVVPVKQKPVGYYGKRNPERQGGGVQNLAKEVHWIQHATFWSQVVLGIIGICALIIYYDQLNEMRSATLDNTKALTETRNAIETSQSQFDGTMQQMIPQTIAQIDSAKAALDGVKGTRDQMMLDQRAWVEIARVQNVPFNSPDIKSPRYSPRSISIPMLRNTGRTPAEGVELIYGQASLSKQQYEAFVKSDVWINKLIADKSAGVFKDKTYVVNRQKSDKNETNTLSDPSYFPSDVYIKDIRVPTAMNIGVLPPDLPWPFPLNEVNLGGGGMLMFGEVSYWDIWRKKRRLTRFCSYSEDISFAEFLACPVFSDMN